MKAGTLAPEAASGRVPGHGRARLRLATRLTAAGIGDARVIGVMTQVPRHLFVDEALATHAYDDAALPIGSGQTISQPYTVARMTEALLAPGCCSTVLEIGTGSGYQTAVLAALVRRVYSVERVAVLWQRAQARLRALQCRNVRLRHGDGALGWQEYAPFDGILITAAAHGVPRQLAAQLAPGGRMVLPLNGGDGQVLLRLTRTTVGFRHEVLEPVTFVPLLAGVA
ncbi:protein-L-isoaspartate(D-aspartate) O-methyltransferase [Thiohalocapsa halophila]|uniref:protein-L-isoaspartate(D-aspartate) O-methyltransferase n=1 Tax=Thiohalocapsa halophila TaxID=69359 RepID=UPI001A9188D7|nr:protein-L-isoaspartate(D-aspartate) O-methyltransferase [Thiohalocapsa halophila]